MTSWNRDLTLKSKLLQYDQSTTQKDEQHLKYFDGTTSSKFNGKKSMLLCSTTWLFPSDIGDAVSSPSVRVYIFLSRLGIYNDFELPYASPELQVIRPIIFEQRELKQNIPSHNKHNKLVKEKKNREVQTSFSDTNWVKVRIVAAGTQQYCQSWPARKELNWAHPFIVFQEVNTSRRLQGLPYWSEWSWLGITDPWNPNTSLRAIKFRYRRFWQTAVSVTLPFIILMKAAQSAQYVDI